MTSSSLAARVQFREARFNFWQTMAPAAVRHLLFEPRRIASNCGRTIRMASTTKALAARDASDPTSLRRLSREDLINLAVGHPAELPSEVMAAAMVDAAERLRDTGVVGESATQELNYVARWGFAGDPRRHREVPHRPVRAFGAHGAQGEGSERRKAGEPHDNERSEPRDRFGVRTAHEARRYRRRGAPDLLPRGRRVPRQRAGRRRRGRVGGGNRTRRVADGTPGYFDVGALERRLRVDGLRPRLVYLVPTHSNPRGGTLPERDRKRLVELAVEFNFYVLADEVYHLLHWGEEPPPPRMCEVERNVLEAAGLSATWDDDAGKGKAAAAWEVRRSDDVYEASAALESSGRSSAARVVSVSSFTKILAPGLRVGWIEAARSIVDMISDRGYVNSGGCVAPFAASIVVSAIENGSQARWLQRLRERYRGTSRALHDAASREEASTGWKVASCPPSGGYFLWIELPADCDERAVMRAAEDAGVGVPTGFALRPSGESPERPREERSCRLCFAYLDEEKIVEGVKRLAESVRNARGK